MASFSNAFSYLQKIGKCMMLPVSVLPVAGILLGVGSANFTWLPQALSQIMAQSGGEVPRGGALGLVHRFQIWSQIKSSILGNNESGLRLPTARSLDGPALF
jgi:hypothetical protein